MQILFAGQRFATALALLGVLTSVAWCQQTTQPPEARRFFAIRIDDRVIGYNQLDQRMIELNGRRRLRIDSETSMKFALLGKTRNSLSQAKVWLDPESGDVVRYESVDTVNETRTGHEAIVADGKIRYRKGQVDEQANDEDAGDESPKKDAGAKPQIFDATGVFFLGNNNFGLWERMLRAASQRLPKPGEATLKVFLPEAATVADFQVRREQNQTLEINGRSVECRSWRLPNVGIRAATDADTGRLVQLRIPGQGALIEPADESIVKLAQKSRAEDLLAKLFINSNVKFDDFMKVEQMTAKINIQVAGVDNDASILQTPMQSFVGEKDDQQRVQGVVTIKSVAYDGADAPGFPMKDVDASLEQWLSPSPLIESDDAAIRKQSAQLTAGAKNRWDAVRKVATWVHNEIAYTIADTPSAARCLETRQGDCGPHSTLTIALLRAAKIPARLVGGVVYTPSFGGSFGQHAWVEVHMGAAGWVAIDPTTDELTQISATHIKLFEGVGGVRPQSIEVTAFEPPNSSDKAFQFAAARPLPWKPNVPYVYVYRQGDQKLGEERFHFGDGNANEDNRSNGADENVPSRLRVVAELNLRLDLLRSLSSKAQLTAAANGRPLKFRRELSALLQTTTIECQFQETKVQTTVSGLTRLEREIDLPPGAFCFDNNFLAGWALAASQLPLEPEQTLLVRTYHPSLMQILPITFNVKEAVSVKIGDDMVECLRCEIEPIKNTFYITRDGRLVKVTQGDLVIELQALEPKPAEEEKP